ncbi:MAG: PQQ-binding-like beta-propeller repeat protein [Pirellulaceae bacterium]|nr:PQQ-binding-like beta-propeller repeat protein [Pirellulaceae bacterium]
MKRVVICIVCSLTLVAGWAGCSKRPRGTAHAVVEVKADISNAGSAPSIEIDDTDWPQWRGLRSDGVALDQPIPESWDESTNVAWKVDVPGHGHASPILVGSLVCLATAIEEQQTQIVVAYDRTTGEERWRLVVHEGGFPSKSEIHKKGTHANSTLASDGQSLYAVFFNSGKIFASAIGLDGKLHWQQEVGDFSSKFGYAPSPIVYENYLIVTADNWGNGYIAALHRDTGKVYWRTKRPAVSTYSTPLIAKIHGRDQLVISGCDEIVSYNPSNGEQLWACSAISEATCGTPVTDGSSIFASGGHPDKQTVAIKGDGSGDIVWKNSTRIYEPSLLVANGCVFGVTDDGIAWCWSADNGKVHWKQRLGGSFSASPILCNGKIFVPNLDGETFIFEAKSDAYHQIARNKIGQDSYACLAIGGDAIFMRIGYSQGQQRNEKLICLRTP